MPFEPAWQDLRSAIRGLRRARAFSAAAILTLAIGIAGTTGMFALIQGVLLRPLPVRDQDQLLVAWLELRTSGAGHWPFHPEDIDTIRRSSRLLDAVAGVDYNGVSPTASVERGAAESETTVSQLGVTGRFFEVLGVQPLIGRALTPADDVAGAEPVIVISHGLWQRRYGGTRNILGRMLPLEEHPFRIVGVMPAQFEFPRGAEAWISLAATKDITDPRFAWGVSVDLLARRRPNVTVDQATTELHALVAQLDAGGPPDRPRGLTPVVRAFTDIIVGDVRKPLLVLFAAVGLVLLIASANVANLLLMRGEARRAELAVRIALGASGGRLARQLLAESLLLAFAASAIGLALAAWSLRPLIAWVPGGLPRLDAVQIDAGVIAFTIVISVIAATMASLAPICSPALRPGGFDLATQLRSRNTGTRTTRGGRRLLVMAQVALAVTVVAAAGLLTRSLLRLQAIDLGLAASRIVFVSLNVPASKYADQTRLFSFLDAITARLDATPGIAATTAINTRPYAGTGGWDVAAFTAEGQSTERSARNLSLNLEGIDPNYFATFEVPILRGRAFTDRDRHGAPLVAIISDDVAAHLWPGEDPVGRRIKMGGPTSHDDWRTIVGVARSTRYRELAVPRPTLYLPARQFDTPGHTLAVRITSSPAPLTTLTNVAVLANAAVQAVDPDVQVSRLDSFDALLAQPLARPRFNAFLIALFGGVALLLAAIGLYAVMAAYVRQRYAEIGIRVALGATNADVRRLVMGEALRLAGGGAIIGLATAMITSRLLRGLLFEVQLLDPAALLIAALLLMGASALACYLPARRAVRIDPVTLLRAE
jgi:putative ABC transport system permease protein